MADLVRKDKVDVLRQTVRQLDEGGYSVDAIVDDAQIRALETRGLWRSRLLGWPRLGRLVGTPSSAMRM
jgi:hypothetical protein